MSILSPDSGDGRADTSVAADLGPSEVAAAIATVNAKNGGTAQVDAGPSGIRGLPFAVLKQCHPSYDCDYWRELRALYEGGKTLLRDDSLMTRLFPRHRAEHDTLYAERKKRAFYVPYAAEIIDHLVAGVTSDPISMEVAGEEPTGGVLPDFYQAFVENVSPDGGAKVSLNELLSDQLRMALQTLWSWILVDLPQSRPDGYQALGDQEKAGALRAYAVPLDPESVVDWEEDSDGEFLWVLTRVVEQKRLAITDTRSRVTERWTYYTPDAWVRFEAQRDADKQFDDKQVIPVVGEGTHSFERVPILRLELPRGLWAMNKMAGVAAEHFNKRSALSWGELQSLLPELYEFHGPEGAAKGSVIGEAQQDPGRAVSQRRGQGFVQVRGHEDRAEFVGPNVAPFGEARQSCDALRDDLHRVMHQMALSAANNSAALKRSAESKQQDAAAVEIVLRELGRLGRKHAEAILNMVSLGRRDQAMVNEWTAKGMAEFDSVAVSDSLQNALDIDMLKIESATFRRRHRMLVVRAVLEGKVKPEDLEQIESELEENITDESIAPNTGLDGVPPDAIPPGAVKIPLHATSGGQQAGGSLKPKRGRPAPTG